MSTPLSREQHCALAGIDIESFKTLKRYGRLPVLPAKMRAKRGFAPIETIALAASNTLVETWGLPRMKAAAVCSNVEAIVDHWKRIRDTSAALTEGRSCEEILFGRAIVPGGSVRALCGTLQEISDENSGMIANVAISISRVAAVIAGRAVDAKIDLIAFWESPILQAEKGKRK